MILSPLAMAILEFMEEFRPIAYQDSGGVWTCGYGHTGPDVVRGTTCSLEQADVWLQGDLAEAEKGVLAGLCVPITQRQFDALVLFAFNVGVTAETRSTLAKLINAGLPAADEFLRWNTIHGIPNTGLTKRRRLERALFLDTGAV